MSRVPGLNWASSHAPDHLIATTHERRCMSDDLHTDSTGRAEDKRAELLLAFRRLHDRWIGGRHNPAAGPPMLCFSYAGGSTAVFRGWEDRLPVNVRPIVLPGHDGRINEPAHTRLTTLVAELAEHIGSQVTPDTMIFGHSMGALLAFEFTRELRRRQMSQPAKLLLSAFRAPQLKNPEKPIYRWPDEVLTAVLRKEGIPSATLANTQIMEALLPTLRADLEVCDTYEFVDEAPLAIPFAIYGGAEDARVTAADLKGWDQHTSRGASLMMIDGPHFFIHSSRDEFLAAVRRDLSTERGHRNAC